METFRCARTGELGKPFRNSEHPNHFDRVFNRVTLVFSDYWEYRNTMHFKDRFTKVLQFRNFRGEIGFDLV